jgi:ADP-ribose pyrophosphatase YjhB (NUDIX family)
MSEEEIHFCLRCGTPVIETERFGKIRPVCPKCGWIYFHDPKVAVAALIEKDGKVLLVRRINDPQRGYWSLPAGFLDAGEDPIQAVQRECKEETGLDVRITSLLTVLAGQEHPRGSHLFIVYRGDVLRGKLIAGDDADEVGWFGRGELPPLAFSTTKQILNQYS